MQLLPLNMPNHQFVKRLFQDSDADPDELKGSTRKRRRKHQEVDLEKVKAEVEAQQNVSEQTECASTSRVRTPDQQLTLDRVYSKDGITDDASKAGALGGSHKIKPAELFRTDYVTAMTVAENDTDFDPMLVSGIVDTWRNEWNRGVQVPVDVGVAPKTEVKPPKLVKLTTSYQTAVSNVPLYDTDVTDEIWLEMANKFREKIEAEPISTEKFEQMLEHFEQTCNAAKGLAPGIEFEEDTQCDICLSPFCDEDNEIVFCDSCEISVHQACYGIQRVPGGQWLCRLCSMGIVRPPCVLCPNLGGAMKSTKSGMRWVHVSCALWIPEITFGDETLMEPVTNISSIPEKRWMLRCQICKQRIGACVQCCYRSCSVAFHVTCAQRNGLDIRYQESADGTDEVKMLSFCEKHGKKRFSPRKYKSLEEQEAIRKQRLAEAQDFFFEQVRPDESAEELGISVEKVEMVYEYWKLKRKVNFNIALVKTTLSKEGSEDVQEQILLRRIQMLVYFRQNLEKARNLCYMLVRREKLKKHQMRSEEAVFSAVKHLLSSSGSISKRDVSAAQNLLFPDGQLPVRPNEPQVSSPRSPRPKKANRSPTEEKTRPAKLDKRTPDPSTSKQAKMTEFLSPEPPTSKRKRESSPRVSSTTDSSNKKNVELNGLNKGLTQKGEKLFPGFPSQKTIKTGASAEAGPTMERGKEIVNGPAPPRRTAVARRSTWNIFEKFGSSTNA